MKHILFSIAAFCLITTMISCSKTKSTDLPLPKVRLESVYITTDNGTLLSYGVYTGVKNWEVITKGNCEGTPVLYKEKIYFVTKTGYFYAVDILTGKALIETNIGIIPESSTSIAINNDKIYLSSSKLYCLNLSGVQIWSYDPTVPCKTSPTVVNGFVFVGIDVNNGAGVAGRCISVNATTGLLNWQSNPIAFGPVVSSPSVSNSVVYYGGTDNFVYAIYEINGSSKWQFSTTDKVQSSPMVYGGMCIVGSDDFGIYCIDTTSGLLRWEYQTAERVSSSPTVHETSNTVLVGSYDFNLYAIDHVTGALRWKYPAGSLIKSSPVVYGFYVYFTSFDRYIYCVDIRDGRLIWKSFMNGNSQSSPIVDDLANGIFPSVSGMSKY